MPKLVKLILSVVSRIITALPNAALAAFFLITWIKPYQFGDKVVSYLLLLMLMEFINVHAAGFLGSVIISKYGKVKKLFSIVGLGLFYTIFVGGFSLAFHVWWPLVAFWGLILNRLLSVFLGRTLDEDRKARLSVSWFGGALCYLVAVFLTLIPFIPALGITDAVISHQALPGSGIWIDEPYRVVAAGCIYFTGVTLISLFDFKIASWFKRGRT
ncbi:MAG: hypothetical protein AABZ39_19365 [Spirochaetota bacterium]